MNTELNKQLKKYLGIFLRRKKLIITCFFISIVTGLGLYLKTPKVYKASSTLIYETQSISISPTQRSLDVNTRLRDMVSTVSQQVTSRSSLETIIKQQKLYAKLLEKMPMEDVVASMRKDISTALNQGDVFMVSFVGSNPNKVRTVTNALAARFIEENLRFREERATEAFIYVKDELKMAKESLDKKEAIMRDYKLQYYSELPEQLANNMSRLNALQTLYQNNLSGAQDSERTRLLIQEQISLRHSMLERQGQRLQTEYSIIGGRNRAGGQRQVNNLQDLEQIRLELEALKIRYTTNHPEVKRQENLLRSMEEALKKKQDMATSPDQNSREALSSDPHIEQLKSQLRDSEYSIAQLKKERLEILAQIDQYKEWIKAVPVREAEWSALTRDYNQLSHHYEGLVSQKLQAESAETLERRQKGSQFKIIDPANLPSKPFKPDFKKIMLIVLALGLGCGGGIAFLLEETLDSSFKNPKELESVLGLPVTCSIPLLLTPEEKRRKLIFSVFWAVTFTIATVSLVGGFAYLVNTGAIIL